MALDELYKEIILDHYKNPHHKGIIENAHIHEGGHNPACGDQLELFVLLDSDEHIEEVRFLGKGCSISQASASIMTDVLPGKSLEEAMELLNKVKQMLKGEFSPDEDDDDFEELIALQGVKNFPVRIKCALLAWTTLEQGMKNLNTEKNC